MDIHTVVFPSRPQIDTICSFYILAKYAEGTFPGISNAVVKNGSTDTVLPKGEYTKDGVLYLDQNESIFDHHNKKDTCLTELVVTFLKLENNKELFKLRAFAKRDDLEGKGIVSQDKLDKAFGLPGLLANLNKLYINESDRIFRLVLPLLDAHVKEEQRREYEMPEEVAKKKNSGHYDAFEITQKGVVLKCCTIESDNVSIGGFLRSSLGGNYDVVAQIKSSGHITILTKNKEKVSLKGLILLLRLEELSKKNIDTAPDLKELLSVGTIDSVPEWYFDPATNSLFNGTTSGKQVSPSQIEKGALKNILIKGLTEDFL